MTAIAIIGASRDRSKYGNKAVRAYKERGDAVYPVNPDESEIEGIRAFLSVLNIPDTVDVASFYVPPEIGLQVIEEVAQKGIAKVLLNPGAESDELLRRCEELGFGCHCRVFDSSGRTNAEGVLKLITRISLFGM